MQDLLIIGVLTLSITMAAGPLIIPFLRKLKLGQYIRDDGPARHIAKSGTPTMGGLIFIIPLSLITIIFVQESIYALTVLTVTVGYATIGFVDDFLKVVLKRPLGLKARYKLSGQVVLAALLAVFSAYFLDRGTIVSFPVLDTGFDLGPLYFPFVLLVLVGSTNAVNLTDGLDGLAAGTTLFVTIGYIFICLKVGRYDLALFASALAGGCLGFLVFNFHPAKVFMGDTGSLALGAAVASLAVLTGTELILPIVGGIYVIEALSVIIQVISFRITGKRVFLMSPIHHHFELAGWTEGRVVFTFWLGAALFSMLGVFTVCNLG